MCYYNQDISVSKPDCTTEFRIVLIISKILEISVKISAFNTATKSTDCFIIALRSCFCFMAFNGGKISQ